MTILSDFIMDAQARDQWYINLEEEDISAVSETTFRTLFGN